MMLRCMRTTIRLPDDLYIEVRVSAATAGTTVTSFIEDALRAALARRGSAHTPSPYRVDPFHGDGTRPGIDLDDNSALLAVMDGDARR